MSDIKLLVVFGWNYLLNQFFFTMNHLAALGQNGKVYVVICKVLLDISASELCFNGYD